MCSYWPCIFSWREFHIDRFGFCASGPHDWPWVWKSRISFPVGKRLRTSSSWHAFQPVGKWLWPSILSKINLLFSHKNWHSPDQYTCPKPWREDAVFWTQIRWDRGNLRIRGTTDTECYQLGSTVGTEKNIGLFLDLSRRRVQCPSSITSQLCSCWCITVLVGYHRSALFCLVSCLVEIITG